MKKNGKVQVNLFDAIVKSKFIIGSFAMIILSMVSIITYIAKLVKSESILFSFQFIDQFIIIVIITSTPVILITWLLMVINYFLSKEKMKRQVYENIVNKDNVDIYDNQENYYV